MGFIVGIAAAIISAVSTTVAVIASVIVTIASAVWTAVTAIAGAVIGVVAGISAGVLNAFGILSGELMVSLGSTLGSISSISGTMFATTTAWISSISGWFHAFLELIHFDTLLAINDIAYLVSSDYREMMNKVYASISEFSQAISGNTMFAIHALENTRTLVLDTSTMLGRPYDLGELTWMVELQTFLKGVQKKAEEYAENPYDMLMDLNEQIVKPAIDMKSEVWKGIFGTIDNLLDITDGVVEDLSTIHEDFVKLVYDLPEKLYYKLEPYVEKVDKKFMHFRNNVYYPMVDKLRTITDKLQETRDAQTDKLDSLVQRLKRPAQYLLEGDKFSPYEQMKDAEIYADLSTRIYRQPVSAWRQHAEQEIEALQKVSVILQQPRALPLWDVGETPLPSVTESVPSIGRASPFPEDV